MINKLTLLNSKSAYARCDWVMREKEMLGQTDHPFVVQLICTYADPTHVYFLMTPALGGAQLADLALALALVLTLALTLALTLTLAALALTLVLTLTPGEILNALGEMEDEDGAVEEPVARPYIASLTTYGVLRTAY